MKESNHSKLKEKEILEETEQNKFNLNQKKNVQRIFFKYQGKKVSTYLSEIFDFQKGSQKVP